MVKAAPPQYQPTGSAPLAVIAAVEALEVVACPVLLTSPVMAVRSGGHQHYLPRCQA